MELHRSQEIFTKKHKNRQIIVLLCIQTPVYIIFEKLWGTFKKQKNSHPLYVICSIFHRPRTFPNFQALLNRRRQLLQRQLRGLIRPRNFGIRMRFDK